MTSNHITLVNQFDQEVNIVPRHVVRTLVDTAHIGAATLTVFLTGGDKVMGVFKGPNCAKDAKAKETLILAEAAKAANK
jgi:hypothetical protein